VIGSARTILAEALRISEGEITEQSTIDNLVGWDSLGHMRLVARIEEVIGRPLEGDEILAADSVPAVARLLAGSAR
jgi:acyl carrier protein